MNDIRTKKTSNVKKIIYIMQVIVLAFIIIISLYPFVFMFLTSLTQKRIMSAAFDFKTMDLRNYANLLSNFNLLIYVKNSLIVVVCVEDVVDIQAQPDAVGQAVRDAGVSHPIRREGGGVGEVAVDLILIRDVEVEA